MLSVPVGVNGTLCVNKDLTAVIDHSLVVLFYLGMNEEPLVLADESINTGFLLYAVSVVYGNE